MRNQVIVFAVAVGLLIVSVSVWIVVRSQQALEGIAPEVELDLSTAQTDEPDTQPASDAAEQPAAEETTEVAASEPEPATKTENKEVDTAATATESVEPTEETTTPAEPTGNRRPGQIRQVPGFAERMAAGTAALTSSDFAKAANEFSAAVELQKDSVDALLRLAGARFGLRQYDQARETLDAVENLDAVHPDLWLLRGRIDIRQGQLVEAEQTLAKAGPAGDFYRGLLAAFYDRTDEAKQLLRSAADAGEKKADSLLSAYAEYELYPDSPKTHLDTLLARSYNQLGEYQLAAAKIQPVITADPDYRDAWLLLGYAYYADQKFEEARTALSTAYKIDPAKPETHYFLGLTYSSLGDPVEAERYFLLARENHFSKTVELTNKLAEVYLAQEKYREAAELYASKTSDPAASIDTFVKPIYLYLEKAKDGVAAWSLARTALARYPDSAQAQNLAGWVSVANGYLPEGRRYLEKAITLDPALAAAYLNLGKYYEAAGDTTAALAQYKKAFDFNASDSVGLLAAENYNRLLEQ